jgi:hypothetical protein
VDLVRSVRDLLRESFFLLQPADLIVIRQIEKPCGGGKACKLVFLACSTAFLVFSHHTLRELFRNKDEYGNNESDMANGGGRSRDPFRSLLGAEVSRICLVTLDVDILAWNLLSSWLIKVTRP